MKVLRYTIIFKEEPEGGYTAIVPSLPGCVTYGKTLAKAKEMALDAIAGYLASLKKHSDPVPSDDSVFFTTVNIRKQKDSYSYA